jgi:hypothetical protein
MKTPSIFGNPNESLNPISLTDHLTDCANSLGRKLTKSEKEFLSRNYRINSISGRPFTYYDHKPYMSQGQYRQHIHNLRPIIEAVNNTNPKQYKNKGLYLDKKLTEGYTELSKEDLHNNELDQLQTYFSHMPVMMHNITLHTRCGGLYESLIEKGVTPNPQNHTINVNVDLGTRVSTSIMISKKDTITIHIGCTHDPFGYSSGGFLNLAYHCGRIEQYLRGLSGTDFRILPLTDWKLVHADFNKDSIRYDFQSKPTLNSMVGHFVIYLHKFPDGSSAIRGEERCDSDTTILEEVHSAKFYKASELE